jgi:hypothetical protein
LSKRRHASGSRQLSTISDGFDPLDLLALMGFDRSNDGQDISFSELLTSQKKTKTNSPNTLNDAVIYNHNLVTRGFSHESAIKSIQCIQNQISIPQNVCNCDNGNANNDDKKHIFHQIYSHHNILYHPNLLDDPELIAGKHSTLLAFPSFVVSFHNCLKIKISNKFGGSDVARWLTLKKPSLILNLK